MRGWPARPPGNSHRHAGLTAVFMFARLAASSVSIAANSLGTPRAESLPGGSGAHLGQQPPGGELAQKPSGLVGGRGFRLDATTAPTLARLGSLLALDIQTRLYCASRYGV